jgi:hypothetical protein
MRTQHLEQQSPDKPEQPEERHPYALDILAMAIGVSFGSAGIAAAACFAIIRRLRCVAVLVVDLGQQLGYNVQTHADAYAWFPYLRNEQSAKELPRKRLPETADSELSRLLVAPLPARSSASSNTHDQASLLQMERIRAEQRQHTIITARPGDGKTHTSICMLVADIVRGCQVLWLSPARILFHHREQPIDLRPLAAAGLLEHHKDPKTIAQVLHLSGQLVAERNEQLEQDEDVGHPICLYLDEWPHLVAECPQIEDTLGKILRTARKTNIWIILATQDAHVETIRLHGGLRAAFSTRLIGNVDRATWNALADPDQERQRVSQGQWVIAGLHTGTGAIQRPSNSFIATLAGTHPPRYPPVLSSPTQHTKSQSNPTSPTHLTTDNEPGGRKNGAFTPLLDSRSGVQANEPANQQNSADESPELPFSSEIELALKAAQVQRLRTELNSPGKNKIIWLVWGARPGDNKAYRAASIEYNRIMEESDS